MNTIINKKFHLNILFFVSGFIFDLITLNRIDHGFMLVQQAVFLVLILILLHLEFKVHLGGKLPKIVNKYKTLALHFLIGSLLSAFVIFYFLSSSGLTSLVFVLAIVSLMVINELPQFQSLSLPFKVSLFSICLISYLSYVTPIWLGFIGFVPLLLSGVLFFLVLSANAYILQKKTHNDKFISSNLTVPGLATLAIFLALYLVRAIPPVPLSIKKIGIYRNIEKKNGHYFLSYKKSFWKFWQNSEQEFYYQAGDKVYCFAGIFSPTKFSDQVKFQWFVLSKNRWVLSDTIPIAITGGRDEGFRAYSFKSKLTAGKWRVKVTTKDEREIGRLTFSVQEGESPYEINTEKY